MKPVTLVTSIVISLIIGGSVGYFSGKISNATNDDEGTIIEYSKNGRNNEIQWLSNARNGN